MAASSSSVISILRILLGAAGHQALVALGEGRAGAVDEEARPHPRDPVDDGLDTSDELGTEDQGVGLGELEAVLDLVGGVAVVHGDSDGPRLEDAEVDGQPLDAVHQQDGDLVALADAAREEQVGEPVGRLVELPPGDLPPGGLHGFGLHQLVLAPGDLARLAQLGIELHETDLVSVQRSVTRDEIGDQHGCPPSRVRFRV